MPIYEYQCQACNHELEKLQKISDEPLSLCPQCGEPQLKRKISAAGFRLKGAGWYETDFKKSGGKKNLAGDSAAPKDSGGDKSGEKSAPAAAPASSTASTSTASPPSSAGTSGA